MPEKVAVAGSGAIACGLAATVAAHHGEVLVLCRSEESAERARAKIAKQLERLEVPDGEGRLRVVTDPAALAGVDVAVEAIVEELETKEELLGTLNEALDEETILATTTSSLPIDALARASGRPQRFAGLHVFNPVTRMELVELVYPEGVDADVPERLAALCAGLGKTAVEVPDTPGFIVNRLLFPYLFDAVRVMGQTGLSPEAIDKCMTLGAGHPMGPIALLDFIGLDVAAAIGGQIGAEVPDPIPALIEAGACGKKAGRGFYEY